MSSFSVVIAGGGVAALEALLRLRRLAPSADITLLAPDEDFAIRALSVNEPFSLPVGARHPLGPIVRDAGARQVKARLSSVEHSSGQAHLDSGETLAFDALLVAVGARPVPALPYATTFDDAHAGDVMRGVVRDIEQGYVKRVAFVAPDGPVWPLPLYELALMTAHAGYEAGWDDLKVTFVTLEPSPLAAFGEEVARGVRGLMADAGIELHVACRARLRDRGQLVIGEQAHVVEADHVVALPRLTGPSVRGLPRSGLHGFIPVGRQCEVPGTAGRVFAAGDATDFPLKHGGVGAQAADVAAAAIARAAGEHVTVPAFHPVVHAKLLTGRGPRYLFARYIGGEGFQSTITEQPEMGATEKVTAAELTPYLEASQASRSRP